MPTVRYTADGGRYRVAGQTFEPGDEGEVSDGLADHLVEDVGDFERVHENVTDLEYREVEDDGGDESEDEAASGDEQDSNEAADEGESADDGEGDTAETCDVVKSDGEVCGRELPCPYHSDEQED